MRTQTEAEQVQSSPSFGQSTVCDKLMVIKHNKMIMIQEFIGEDMLLLSFFSTVFWLKIAQGINMYNYNVYNYKFYV